MPTELKKIIEYYKGSLSEWAKESGKDYMYDEIQQIAFVTKNYGKGLDIGSGKGTLSILLAKRGINMIALDLLKKMNDLTRENAKREGVSSLVTPMLGNFFDAKFKDQEFDFIVSSAIPELYENFFPILDKMTRILKEDGEIVLMFMSGAKIPLHWMKKAFKDNPRYKYIHDIRLILDNLETYGLYCDGIKYFEYRYLLNYNKLIRRILYPFGFVSLTFEKIASYFFSTIGLKRLFSREILLRIKKIKKL